MKNAESIGNKQKPSLSCKNTERKVSASKSISLGLKKSIADLRKRYPASSLKPYSSLELIVKKNLIRNHNSTQAKYCSIKINNIIFNEKSRLVACFKDYLIEDDMSEFLKRYYMFYESLTKLDNILDFYNKYATFYPNYCSLSESRYLYKNIMKKQKIILLLDPHKRRMSNPLQLKPEVILSDTIINSIANQTDFTVEENCYQNFVSETETMNFTPLKSVITKVSLSKLSTSVIELYNFANSNFNKSGNKDDNLLNKESTSLSATVRTLKSKSKYSPIGIAPLSASIINNKISNNQSHNHNTRNCATTKLGKQLQVASTSNSNYYSTMQCENPNSKALQRGFKNNSNPINSKYPETTKKEASTAKKRKPNLDLDLPKKDAVKNIPQSTKNKSSSLPKFESIFKTSSHRTESEPKKPTKIKEEPEKKLIKVIKKVNACKPNVIGAKRVNNQTPVSSETVRDQPVNKLKNRKINVNINIKAPRKNVKITFDNNYNTNDSKKSKLNSTENGVGSKIICDNSNKPNVNIIIKNIQVVNNYNTINSSYLDSKNRMKDRNSIERLVKNHLKPIIESQLLNSHNRMRSASNYCSEKLANSKPKVTITTSQSKHKA